jgi:hypothetical protein
MPWCLYGAITLIAFIGNASAFDGLRGTNHILSLLLAEVNNGPRQWAIIGNATRPNPKSEAPALDRQTKVSAINVYSTRRPFCGAGERGSKQHAFGGRIYHLAASVPGGKGRSPRFAKPFPRAGAAIQCASSRTSVASQDAHSNLRSLRCGPVWITLTSHIGSPQEGQRGRSATNTIEVKTQSVRGTASSRSGADGARFKRLIHGAVPFLGQRKEAPSHLGLRRRMS